MLSSIGSGPPSGVRFPPIRFVPLALVSFVSIGVYSWLNGFFPAKRRLGMGGPNPCRGERQSPSGAVSGGEANWRPIRVLMAFRGVFEGKGLKNFPKKTVVKLLGFTYVPSQLHRFGARANGVCPIKSHKTKPTDRRRNIE